MSNEAIEQLKAQMAYALSKQKSQELSNILTSVITGLSDDYSPGESILALTLTLAMFTAVVKPGRMTTDEWYGAVEAVLKQSYTTAFEKLRRG